jgi:hypothetical protein
MIILFHHTLNINALSDFHSNLIRTHTNCRYISQHYCTFKKIPTIANIIYNHPRFSCDFNAKIPPVCACNVSNSDPATHAIVTRDMLSTADQLMMRNTHSPIFPTKTDSIRDITQNAIRLLSQLTHFFNPSKSTLILHHFHHYNKKSTTPYFSIRHHHVNIRITHNALFKLLSHANKHTDIFNYPIFTEILATHLIAPTFDPRNKMSAKILSSLNSGPASGVPPISLLPSW